MERFTHMAYAERNMLDLEAKLVTRFLDERSDRLASEIRRRVGREPTLTLKASD
jgi:hypothetical protein